MDTVIRPIAHIESDFATKFGIPRQAGIVEELEARVIFEPAYRVRDALRGLEDFSHIWLIWQFSGAVREDWSPTVRPPRLGGNKRMGVFATRSPNRPNPLGLSSVKIERIEFSSAEGPVIYVSGADLLDGTPIFDLKPYLPYTDSHPDARGGFGFKPREGAVEVECDEALLAPLPRQKRKALLALLREDPRPGYTDDPERIFGMEYAGFDIRFKIRENTLKVLEINRK